MPAKTPSRPPTAGSFRPGCKPGPGRPRRETERERLEQLSEAITPDIWAKVIQRAVEDAVAGDGPASKAAREWLSKYLIGDKLTIEHEGPPQAVTIYLPRNGRESDN